VHLAPPMFSPLDPPGLVSLTPWCPRVCQGPWCPCAQVPCPPAPIQEAPTLCQTCSSPHLPTACRTPNPLVPPLFLNLGALLPAVGGVPVPLKVRRLRRAAGTPTLALCWVYPPQPHSQPPHPPPTPPPTPPLPSPQAVPPHPSVCLLRGASELGAQESKGFLQWHEGEGTTGG